MTETSEVVVLGGGIVGSFVARALALRGIGVTVVDPAAGEGASSGNAGLLVPSYGMPLATPRNLLEGIGAVVRRDPHLGIGWPPGPSTLGWLAGFVLAARPGAGPRTARELHDHAVRSIDRYLEVAAAHPGIDLRRAGWLWAYRDERALRSAAGLARAVRRAGSSCEVLSAAACREREPGLGDDVVGGLWFPDEYALDPRAATAAVIADAVAHGARIRADTAAGLQRSGVAAVGVRLAGGDVIPADAVVLATGADSRAIARRFGARLPVEAGWGWSLTLGAPDPPVSTALLAAEEHVVVSPAAGRIRITSGMTIGGPRPQGPDAALISAMRSAAERLVPGLRGLPELARWIGARPMTPDGRPRVHRLGRWPNVIAATGHGTLGMTLAPHTGDVVLGLVDEILRAPKGTTA